MNKLNLDELDKLYDYLVGRGYKVDRIDDYSTSFGRHQIVVYSDSKEYRLWDAICHYGSYGFEKGLLEIMGIITEQDVEGYLTADNIIERLENADKITK